MQKNLFFDNEAFHVKAFEGCPNVVAFKVPALDIFEP
jgi:hypothetical protein